MRLVFKDARIVRTSQFPGEDTATQTLMLRALLTRTLAEQLKCRDLCFCESGVPRRFDTLKLAEKIENCEVVLDSGTWLANQISHFHIGRPKEASETDASLEIVCTLHFDIGVPLVEWLQQTNKGQFQMTVKPPKEWRAQCDLAFDDKPEASEDDEQEPIEQHLQCEALEEHEAQAGPVLASAREANGGTHQRGRRRLITTDVQ